ncbi:hypothetical protein ACWTU6_00650 [Mesorhizobium sp. BHbsci]
MDKEKRRHNQQAGAIIIEKTGFRQMALSPCGDSAAIPRPATHDIVAIPAGKFRRAIVGIGRIAKVSPKGFR